MSYLKNTFASQTSKTFAGDIRFECTGGSFALDFVSCDGRKSLTGLFWVVYHAHQHTVTAKSAYLG